MSDYSRPKTILVGFDGRQGSRDALELARRLAGSLAADIAVAVVIRWDPPVPLDLGPYEEALSERFERTFALASEQLGTQRFARHELTGRSPARQLTHLAQACEADLLVVGSSERGPLGRIYPGSVTSSLLAGATCPVAVAPRGLASREKRSVETIGVGFDARPEAELALRYADDLADEIGARLELLAVVSYRPSLSDEFAHPLDVRAVERERLERGSEAATAATGAELSASAVLDGDPAEVLADRSDDLDLIVIGSRGYGRLAGVLLGGVGARLVRLARCPVIVVPAGSDGGADRRQGASAAAGVP